MDTPESTTEKVLAGAILAVILLATAFILLGEAAYLVSRANEGKRGDAPASPRIDWASLYPFPPDAPPPAPRERLSAPAKIARKYSEAMSNAGHLGERWLPNVPGHPAIAACGFVLRAALADPGVGEQFVRLGNGCWTAVAPTPEPPATTGARADAVAGLDRFCRSLGIPFLLVQPPVQNCRVDPRLPPGTLNFRNDDLDALLDALSLRGVPAIDMRQALHRDFTDHYALFYRTDFHWTPDAGLWAAGVVAQELHDRFGLPFDFAVLDPGRYTPVRFPDAQFGAPGQTVTRLLASPEDMVVPHPGFPTDLYLSIPDKAIDRDGTFGDLLIDHPTLDRIVADGGGFAYEALLYGNRPLVRITNRMAPRAPRLLMVRDSFSLAIAPYLALACSQLDLLDVRSNRGNFSGSVRACVEQMRPDAVLMLVLQPGFSYR